MYRGPSHQVLLVHPTRVADGMPRVAGVTNTTHRQSSPRNGRAGLWGHCDPLVIPMLHVQRFDSLLRRSLKF